jgi:hypothetical protein
MTNYGTSANSPHTEAASSDPRFSALGEGPTQLPIQGVDTVAWAVAQGLALTKIKIFSGMAKSINDQQ